MKNKCLKAICIVKYFDLRRIKYVSNLGCYIRTAIIHMCTCYLKLLRVMKFRRTWDDVGKTVETKNDYRILISKSLGKGILV
jgi:hypothetical protein